MKSNYLPAKSTKWSLDEISTGISFSTLACMNVIVNIAWDLLLLSWTCVDAVTLLMRINISYSIYPSNSFLFIISNQMTNLFWFPLCKCRIVLLRSVTLYWFKFWTNMPLVGCSLTLSVWTGFRLVLDWGDRLVGRCESISNRSLHFSL